jgi:excisionase family DNA binding protein
VRDRLLTTLEVAERLGVCGETVLRWGREAKLPRIELPGNVVRHRESDIDRWLEEHTTGAAALGQDTTAGDINRGVSPPRPDAARLPVSSPLSPPHKATTEED